MPIALKSLPDAALRGKREIKVVGFQTAAVLLVSLIKEVQFLQSKLFFLFVCQVRIDHKTKAISFGLDLHVAHKEEVPEGPYLQVWLP